MINENKVEIAYNRGYRINMDGVISNPRGKIIKGGCNSTGYILIGFTINGKGANIKAHRLQAYIKYGNDMFKPGIVVRHLNDVKTDNTWDNITIGTQQDNMRDISLERRIAINLKHKKPRLRKCKYNYNDIIEFHKTSPSVKYTMNEFNIKYRGVIHNILKTQQDN